MYWFSSSSFKFPSSLTGPLGGCLCFKGKQASPPKSQGACRPWTQTPKEPNLAPSNPLIWGLPPEKAQRLKGLVRFSKCKNPSMCCICLHRKKVAQARHCHCTVMSIYLEVGGLSSLWHCTEGLANRHHALFALQHPSRHLEYLVISGRPSGRSISSPTWFTLFFFLI